jgi:hypothetical protein
MSDKLSIVFLDFDGVLNSNAYLTRLLARGSEHEADTLDPIQVERLNKIVEATGASVVISSSWRHGRTTARLRNLLERQGFRGRVIGKTPEWIRKTEGGLFAGETRGHEIQHWMDNADQYGIEVGTFIILDDDPNMAHLADRHIKTYLHVGMLEEHMEQAIEMLKAPMPTIII